MKIRSHIDFDPISILMLLALLAEEHVSSTFILLLAALIHECGHLWIAHILHISIGSLHISMLGARLELKDPLLSYEKEWALCMAGPLFSLFFSALAAWIAAARPDWECVRLFSVTSYALGIVNLLPIGWLDGGRIFRALCMMLLPTHTANLLLQICSFLFLLFLWMISVYLLIRVGNSLKLFVFSLSLFFRFFLSKRGHKKSRNSDISREYRRIREKKRVI